MGKRSTQELSPDEFYTQLKKQHEKPRATIIAGVLLAVFFLLVFFAMPPQLPWIVQRLFGAVNATLSMLVVVFGVKEYARKHQTFDLPFWKKIKTGTVAGGALFALVLAWWLSPLAPIKVGMPGADEVATLLSDEMTLAVLVMPDTTLAVIEPPLTPPSAVAIAKRISNDADPYSLLVKAIAERRFIEATTLVAPAESAGVDAVKLAVAQGQLAVFAGKYADSLTSFDKAVAAGGDANVISQQAVAYALAGDLTKAYEISTQLLNKARTGAIGGTDALGISLNLKAALAMTTGRLPEAVTLIEESQQSWESSSTDTPHKAASRNNQAVIYTMFPKKFAGAETQLDGATSIWRDVYGSNSGHVASSGHNLGVLAISQAKFADAEKRLNSSLQLVRQNYPPGSAGEFASLNALVRLYTLMGSYPMAAKFSEESQKATNQLPQLEMAHHAARGALLTGQGAYRDAAGSFGRTIDLGKQVAVPDHVFLADVRTQKASLNSLRGRAPSTISECESAIAIFDKQVGSHHPWIAQPCNTLGWEYVRAGKKPEAGKQFDRALEIFAANKKEISISPDESYTMAGLAQRFARREWNSALDNLREAVKIEAEVFGPVLGIPEDSLYVETPRTADYLFDEAKLYTGIGGAANYDKAADLFEHVVEIREKLLPPKHPAMAETYEAYAELLTKMDRKEQATTLEKKAEEARKLAKEDD